MYIYIYTHVYECEGNRMAQAPPSHSNRYLRTKSDGRQMEWSV